MGASLVDIVGGIGTLVLLSIFFRTVWSPRKIWRHPGEPQPRNGARLRRLHPARLLWAWSPFLLLIAFVVIWGMPQVAKALDSVSVKAPVPGLDMQVVRMPPVTPEPHPEPAIFDISWLSSPGTGTFFAGLLAGPIAGLSFLKTIRIFFRSSLVSV